HHGVDGVFELENLALHVDGDLAREVAARHRGRHLGDVADLRGQVGCQQIDVVGQVLPGAGDAGHHRLPAEAPVGADLARHPGRHLGDVAHLRGQVTCHRIDAVGQVLPGAGDAGHVGLTAEAPVGADLARHPRHLAGEAVELVDHGVEGLFELQNLAAHV